MQDLERRENRTRRVRTPLLLAPLLLLVTAAFAADRRQADAAFVAETIRTQITYLASDALQGRGSGTPGNEKAAQFVAAEFARYGLKPVGTAKQKDPTARLDGSGYFQPFSFTASRVFGKNNRLETLWNGKTERWKPGRDFEPSGICASGKAEGVVVFTGYGIRDREGKHDDFRTGVQGKIVLLLAGSPNGDPHHPLAEYAAIRRKALTAREKGAAAVLVIVPKEQTFKGAPEAEETADAGLPVLRVARETGERWMRQSSQDLAKLQSQADTGAETTCETPITVRLTSDVQPVRRVTANVVGLVEGSDPLLKQEVVVIGAHMDHLGLGGHGSRDTRGTPVIHHGADDNASGTAGVLSLARYFGHARHSGRLAATGENGPRRSILLICFSGEELGLLGSDHYVRHPILPLERAVAMLNMDMIGRLRDNKLLVIGSGTAKEWNELLDSVNKPAGFAISRSESGFGASDHQSFYLHQIPVLFFFTGTHADYHRPSDTADKIDVAGEARVLRLVAACADHIADSSTRPTFQKVQTADPNAPSRGFSVYFGSVPDYAAEVEGVSLNGVRDGSPAAKAGLKGGDIIVRFGEKSIKNVYDYTYALQDCKPGDVVAVTVKRGAQRLVLQVKLEARPER